MNPKPRTVSRRQSREAAFRVLFGCLFTHQPFEEAMEKLLSMEQEEEERVPLSLTITDFSQLLLEKYDAHLEDVDEALESALTNWQQERLAAADAALLRLGITELLYFPDVPQKVAINEYIELSKLYGDDESPGFLNGVLDRVRKENARD